jgi:N-acetylated-alpha-linked acidic dipeptidase
MICGLSHHLLDFGTAVPHAGGARLRSLAVAAVAPPRRAAAHRVHAQRAAAQRAAEQAAIARPIRRASVRSRAHLADRPHIAGTAAQARTRDLVIEALKARRLSRPRCASIASGCRTRSSTACGASSRSPKELDLREGRIAEDPTTLAHDEYPTVNGYSGTGDVTGDVVYVNYGLVEDYAHARFARRLGAGQDRDRALRPELPRHQGARSGEARGAGAAHVQRPGGRWLRAGRCLSRGPVPQRSRRAARQRDERRRAIRARRDIRRSPTRSGSPEAQMPVPRIPVLPLSYGNAVELLKDVRGSHDPARLAGRSRVPLSRGARALCARA